jgi:HEAT repeat protein
MVLTPRAPEATSANSEQLKQFEEERTELLPLILALKNQGPALTSALGDSDSYVRLHARRALEDLTNPQMLLLQRANAARPSPFQTTKYSKSPSGGKDPLEEGLQETVLALTKGLRDKEAAARRAALDVLEALGHAASPAGPALIDSLADPDRFVRWAAARILGKISPAHAATAVPALALVLNDIDLDLSLAAATALERYGKAAKTAVPDLIRTLKSTDAVLRVAVIQALGAVGGPEAHAAIGELKNLVADPDARVRQAAAEVLGKFGPASAEAVKALNKALQDANPDVQKAAGEALLKILRPGKR